MSIWKRILLFLTTFLLVLGLICIPFRGSLPSWIATLRNSWDDVPYQLVGAGASGTSCAAAVEEDGVLSLCFFDPLSKKSATKWEITLPEKAAQGDLCMLYPDNEECAFLGVYEEDSHYLSLYRLRKGETVELLLREECAGSSVEARQNNRALSSVSRQQEILYFTLLTGEDTICVYSYNQEDGFNFMRESARNGTLSAVALSDRTYRGEEGELLLTYVGNGIYYLNGQVMKVFYADLSTETHDVGMVKLEEYIGDCQLTSISLTQSGSALLLLDGQRLILVEENGSQDLTDLLFTSRTGCIIRVAALAAAALIVSILLYWFLVGRSRGRLPLAAFWGVVSLALFLLAGVVILCVFFTPVKEQIELMEKLELTDDIVDLALTEHSIGDASLPDILSRSLADTNGMQTNGLRVEQVHQEGDKWFVPLGIRAEAAPSVRMACLSKAEENDGVAAEKSGGRFWYCMKQGEQALFISYDWAETDVPSKLDHTILIGMAALAAAVLVVLMLIGRDVRRTSRGLERYAGDQEWVKVRVSGGDELEGMASTLNSLAADRREEERRREQIITSYRRFVPEEILKLLGKRSVLDVDQHTIASRQMAVMRITFRFPDPVYTNAANTMLMFDSVNQVIEHTASIVRQKGGVVFNIAYNGYDVVMELDLRQVISTAVAVRQEVLTFNEQRALDALPTVVLRITIDEGGVILGIVGDQAQLEPSTVSDCFATLVELAKVCDMTESNILCTESITAGMEGYGSRYVGKCSIGGKMVRTYEVFDGDLYEVRKGKEAGLRQFSEGVLSLYSGDISRAKRVFLDLVRDTPLDGCARYYLYLADKLTEDEVLNGLALNVGLGLDWTESERRDGE